MPDHPWLKQPQTTKLDLGASAGVNASMGVAEPHPNPRDQRSNADPGHASARPAVDGFAAESKNAVYDGR